jgi:ABC-2 type transport system ATP-binding protein
VICRCAGGCLRALRDAAAGTDRCGQYGKGTDMLLELVDVTKVFNGRLRGVDGVTMRLGTGLLGLLGPNGAGKSSLMRIAATVTRPSSGQVLLDGTDVVARPDLLRRNLGYLPQDFGVYPQLSAREFLSYLAAVKGMPARTARTRIGELLELLDLAGAGKRPLGKYSGGMLRRVGIAQALLADPAVLIVDEPTAGLDPEQRVAFRNLLADLAADRVVLLSTHIVSDIESVAADIAIMAGGRLLLRGRPDDLLRQASGRTWELTVRPGMLAPLRDQYPVSKMVRTAEGIRVRLLAPSAPASDAALVPPDLEDAYLTIIHGPARREVAAGASR